jgi:hypothetical protein
MLGLRVVMTIVDVMAHHGLLNPAQSINIGYLGFSRTELVTTLLP